MEGVATLLDLEKICKRDDSVLLEYLQDASLVRRNLRCKGRSCRRYCAIRRREDYQLSHCFFCKTCKKKYSVLEGSFFCQTKIPIRTMLYLIWHWICEIRTGCAAMSLGLTKATVIQHYRYLRDICSWKLLQDDDLFLLGGEGHVVQIDESVITKRKYNVGRVVPQKWILGIYDITRKKGLIIFINNRSSATLMEKIKSHVLPGSHIWTDCWRGYRELSNLDGVFPYIHSTVNHSRNFKDPVTGVCTNQVEGYWSRLKQFLRRLAVVQSPFLEEYLDHFMWWDIYGPSPSDRFYNILDQISQKYTF